MTTWLIAFSDNVHTAAWWIFGLAVLTALGSGIAWFAEYGGDQQDKHLRATATGFTAGMMIAILALVLQAVSPSAQQMREASDIKSALEK